MSLREFIKFELKNWTKFEIILFPISILGIIFTSVVMKDNFISTFYALCSICYTILAGKGKLSCYFIGMFGTVIYVYLAFSNGLIGNCLLYGLYYLPMEVVGFFNWRKHLNKDTREILKTQLTPKNRIIYVLLASFVSMILAFILKYIGGKTPLIDATVTIFSILGMYLTVKRCIEQWYIWFFVNLLSMIMWYFAYINGSKSFSLILMWFIYLILSIYFCYNWKKELIQIKEV